MIPYLALVLAVLVSVFAWPLVAGTTAARLTFVAVTAAMGYWYWVPSINILAGGYLGEEMVVPDPILAAEAVWVVLVYHVAAVAVLALVVPASDPAGAERRRPEPRLPMLAFSVVVFGAAVALLVWAFADKGSAIVLQIVTGGISAREVMSFDNFSATLADSLRALLEVVIIFVALFILARAALDRRLVSPTVLLAFGAVVVVFLATGTRATLLMSLVAILLALASGRRVASRGTSVVRIVLGPLLAIALVVPVMIGASARESITTGQTNPVLAVLVVNNDMFRELVFTMSQMESYRSTSWVDFAMVPLTDVTPRFLGFNREVPEHLLAFNMARSGIDLILGAGNVFPGIIADFQLVFGWFGPLAFAGFIGIFCVATGAMSVAYPAGITLVAAQVAAAAFLFFSFRNIHPGLALVVLGAPIGLWILDRMGLAMANSLPHARRA